MQRNFYSELKYSSFFHLLAFFLMILPHFFAPLKKPYVPSMKVDLVGLPEILKKDAKTHAQGDFNQKIEKIIAETKNLQVKTASLSAKQKLEKRNQRALHRIQSLERLESHPEEKLAGNQLSSGSSILGEITDDEKSRYNDAIVHRIRLHWVLPPWIARENLAAQVQMTLNTRGQLASLQFIHSSGNASFDQAIRKTIEESTPFPIPPDSLADSLLHEGILLGFPL